MRCVILYLSLAKTVFPPVPHLTANVSCLYSMFYHQLTHTHTHTRTQHTRCPKIVYQVQLWCK
jgi:hypothetical protein